MGDTTVNGIAARLRADVELLALLPGGVWTRRIKPNDNPPESEPTPGSTPDAFDDAGRIRRCAAIMAGPQADDPGGGETYWGFPEIYLRCLPLESEKVKLLTAARRIERLLNGHVIAGLAGEGIVLSIAGRMGLEDDDTLPAAMVDMIRVQTASIW